MPIPRSLCPSCGYLNGAHSYPAANDILVCLNCGTTNRLDAKRKLISATQDDLDKLNYYQRETIEAMQRHIVARGPIMKPELPS
jgi:hypothetical protein